MLTLGSWALCNMCQRIAWKIPLLNWGTTWSCQQEGHIPFQNLCMKMRAASKYLCPFMTDILKFSIPSIKKKKRIQTSLLQCRDFINIDFLFLLWRWFTLSGEFSSEKRLICVWTFSRKRWEYNQAFYSFLQMATLIKLCYLKRKCLAFHIGKSFAFLICVR